MWAFLVQGWSRRESWAARLLLRHMTLNTSCKLGDNICAIQHLQYLRYPSLCAVDGIAAVLDSTHML